VGGKNNRGAGGRGGSGRKRKGKRAKSAWSGVNPMNSPGRTNYREPERGECEKDLKKFPKFRIWGKYTNQGKQNRRQS